MRVCVRACVCMCVFVYGGGGDGRIEGGGSGQDPAQIGSFKLHVNYSKDALTNFHDFKFCTFSIQILASLTFK